MGGHPGAPPVAPAKADLRAFKSQHTPDKRPGLAFSDKTASRERGELKKFVCNVCFLTAPIEINAAGPCVCACACVRARSHSRLL